MDLNKSVGLKLSSTMKHARAGKIKLVGPAVTYNGRKMEVRMAPPWLSEHTEEVGLFTGVVNGLVTCVGDGRVGI